MPSFAFQRGDDEGVVATQFARHTLHRTKCLFSRLVIYERGRNDQRNGRGRFVYTKSFTSLDFDIIGPISTCASELELSRSNVRTIEGEVVPARNPAIGLRALSRTNIDEDLLLSVNLLSRARLAELIEFNRRRSRGRIKSKIAQLRNATINLLKGVCNPCIARRLRRLVLIADDVRRSDVAETDCSAVFLCKPVPACSLF